VVQPALTTTPLSFGLLAPPPPSLPSDVCDFCPTLATEENRDDDRDGVGNEWDNCVDVPNPDQADRDLNGVGDACTPLCPHGDCIRG
jgi:hypothetical protein